MGKNSKQTSSLGLKNTAMLRAAETELAIVMRERAKSGGSGAHANPAEKRARTRSAQLRKALKEQE